MIDKYIEYSSIDIDELNKKIQNHKLNPTIEGLIYDSIEPGFNSDKNLMISKYQLMSPYMLTLILNSGYKSFLEFTGSGILSELIKEINPSSVVTYANVNSNLFEFIKWRINREKNDIRLLELNNNFKINDIYDVIISDGFLQYFSEDDQLRMAVNMVDKISKNGILCLLIDISGHSEKYPLYKDVDIVKIHKEIEKFDMVCIYGKNTFSSLWKKMI